LFVSEERSSIAALLPAIPLGKLSCRAPSGADTGEGS
jgi:hypothetical protein